MAQSGYYCEECVEEIAERDVFWEGERAYCGKCGSELDLDSAPDDVLDHIDAGDAEPPMSTDYDEEEEEDEEALGFGDAFAEERDA